MKVDFYRNPYTKQVVSSYFVNKVIKYQWLILKSDYAGLNDRLWGAWHQDRLLSRDTVTINRIYREFWDEVKNEMESDIWSTYEFVMTIPVEDNTKFDVVFEKESNPLIRLSEVAFQEEVNKELKSALEREMSSGRVFESLVCPVWFLEMTEEDRNKLEETITKGVYSSVLEQVLSEYSMVEVFE